MDPNNSVNLRVSVEISNAQSYGGGALRLSEELSLPNMGLMQMAAVIAKFHDVISEMKNQQAQAKK